MKREKHGKICTEFIHAKIKIFFFHSIFRSAKWFGVEKMREKTTQNKTKNNGDPHVFHLGHFFDINFQTFLVFYHMVIVVAYKYSKQPPSSLKFLLGLPSCHQSASKVHLQWVSLQSHQEKPIPQQTHRETLKKGTQTQIKRGCENFKAKCTNRKRSYHPLLNLGLFVVTDVGISIWKVDSHPNQDWQEAQCEDQDLEDLHLEGIGLFARHPWEDCGHNAGQPHPLPKHRFGQEQLFNLHDENVHFVQDFRQQFDQHQATQGQVKEGSPLQFRLGLSAEKKTLF